MRRGLLLLVLSVLLISFVYADSVSFNYITGDSIISSVSPVSDTTVDYNNGKETIMGFVLFPFVAPLVFEYNLFNTLISRIGITGNVVRNSVSPKEITIGIQKDVVSSSANTPGASISETNPESAKDIPEKTSNTDNETQTEANKNAEIQSEIQHKLSETETEITANIIGTQSKIQIRKTFYTTSTVQADIISDIISKFAITQENASNLLKIETEEEETEIDEEPETANVEDRLKIKVNINKLFTRVSIKKDFVLNTTNQADIVNAVVSESQLTSDEMTNVLKINDIKDIVKEEHKFKFGNVQCLDNCECMGSVIRCEFENGTRIMTVTAGNSGNVIIQIMGENMTTNVTLYKSGEHIYGVFAGNDTREITILPDQVKESIRAKIKAKLQDKNITLDENGTYQYDGEKQARLFLVIPVKVHVQAHIDSETGIVSNVQSPWWSALAKDE